MLRALAERTDGATVAELATLTDLDRAVLYRLLDTLSEEGFVARDGSSRRYHLGVALVELGAKAGRGLEVRRLARPVMRQLMEQCREAVCLAVRDEADVVVVDRAEPAGLFVRVGYAVGFRHGLDVGAHGRALAAFLPRNAEAVLSPAMLADIRTKGFAVSSDELETGASGVAAPILDRHGVAVAALGLVAPTPRLPDPALHGPRLRHACLEISRRLGYTDTDQPG